MTARPGTRDLVVVVPPESALGYRLAGVRTRGTASAAEVASLVDAEIAGGAAMVAVDARWWAALPAARRLEWTAMTDPLVVALPDEGGPRSAASGGSDLKTLLAHAVGYEISFVTEEETS